MSSDASQTDYFKEILSGVGAVQARRMFGGQGLYAAGLMFALVIDGELYLKTDEENRPAFAAAGCSAWRYAGKGRLVETSYWSVPAEAMDDREAMTPWARLALDAAGRKAVAKPAARKFVRKPPADAKEVKKTRNKKVP